MRSGVFGLGADENDRFSVSPEQEQQQEEQQQEEPAAPVGQPALVFVVVAVERFFDTGAVFINLGDV